MDDSGKLIAIKVVHTLVWVFFVSVIFYILYSGLSGNINSFTWICVGLTFIEAIVLLAFRWSCPLTIMARKYSDSEKDNFDIYLPNWLAKHNKTIFTTIFLISLLLVTLRTLS